MPRRLQRRRRATRQRRGCCCMLPRRAALRAGRLHQCCLRCLRRELMELPWGTVATAHLSRAPASAPARHCSMLQANYSPAPCTATSNRLTRAYCAPASSHASTFFHDICRRVHHARRGGGTGSTACKQRYEAMHMEQLSQRSATLGGERCDSYPTAWLCSKACVH